MENRDDVNLRTFNTAKKYAEEILFPIMHDYQKYQRQSDFGCANLDDSIMLPEEIREIERFNGLKAMNDTLYSLATTITSTIRMKKNKVELEQLNLIISTLEKLKIIFYDHKERFFTMQIKSSKSVEVLDRIYFEQIKKIISICYANTEMLMTKNKLLFSDQQDDYLVDKEIMEQIKQEYVEG